MTTSASDVSFLKASERDLSSKTGVSSLPVLSFDFSTSPSPAFRQGWGGGVRELWNYPHFDVLSVIAQGSLIRRTLQSLPRLKQPQDLVQKVARLVMEMNCYCCLVAKLCPTLSTPWTVARQASLSMGFSRQAYWSGLPFPKPGNLPDPEIKPRSPALRADSLPTELQGKLLNYNLRI